MRKFIHRKLMWSSLFIYGDFNKKDDDFLNQKNHKV